MCFGALAAGGVPRSPRAGPASRDRRARHRHDVAHHLLAIDRVGHADGGGVGDARDTGQHVVDFDRRDVDPAADDQLARATGEVQIAVAVEHAEIAGQGAARRVDHDAPVLADLAIRVVGKAADLDKAGLAGPERAPVRIDDGEALVWQGPARRAEAPALDRARGDPARLAGAVALHDRDAESLLEAAPFIGEQGRGTRRHEAQRRQGDPLVVPALQQHIDDRRISRGDGRAKSSDVGEERRTRETAPHQERRALAERGKRKKLRRCPAIGPVVIEPVAGREPVPVCDRGTVAEHLPPGQHDPLGARGRARRKGDHRIVGRARVGAHVGRDIGKIGEHPLALPVRPAPERTARHVLPGREVFEPEPSLANDQRGREGRQDVAEMARIHLDMDGADGRAGRHRAEIDRELLERVAGEQDDPVVPPDAERRVKRAKTPDRPKKLGVGDGPPILDRNDGGLVGMRRRARANPPPEIGGSQTRHRSIRSRLRVIRLSTS